MDTNTVENRKPAIDQSIIIRTLLDVGVNPAHKGYQYIKTAISLVIEDPSYISNITKRLYPIIAKEHNTLPSRVERACRHAIEYAFSNTDPDVIYHYFGGLMSLNHGKVTNTTFIATMAEIIEHDMEREKVLQAKEETV